jgi:hypothetical protein
LHLLPGRREGWLVVRVDWAQSRLVAGRGSDLDLMHEFALKLSEEVHPTLEEGVIVTPLEQLKRICGNSVTSEY